MRSEKNCVPLSHQDLGKLEGRRGPAGDEILHVQRGNLGLLWVFAGRRISPRLALAQDGSAPCASNFHYQTAIYAGLHGASDNMGLRDFFCRPPKNRRAPNKAQSVAGSIEGGQFGLVTLPHSEPDLRIGSSILPTPAPSTPRGGSNGMRTTTPRVIHLTILPYNTENVVMIPYNPLSKQDRLNSWNPQSMLFSRV